MVYRDFDAAVAETQEAPRFKLGGEEFTARRRLPFPRYVAMNAARMEALEAGELDELVEVQRFMNLALKPAEYDRFMELIMSYDEDDEDESYVSPHEIDQVVTWLMEYYSGKASENDSKSGTGVSKIGQSRRRLSSASPLGA